MLVNRWEASIQPTLSQARVIFENEGLEPFEEIYSQGVKIAEHRHPFTEVRMILKGQLLFNIAGNQFLLRPGDRLEVPANTKHSHVNNASEDCICLCAQKSF